MAKRTNQSWRGRRPGGSTPQAGPWFFRLLRLERKVARLERRETGRTKKEVERAKVQKVLEKYRHAAFMDRMKRRLSSSARWGRRF